MLKDPKLREKCAESLRAALEDIKQQLLQDPGLVHEDWYEDITLTTVKPPKKSMPKQADAH